MAMQALFPTIVLASGGVSVDFDITVVAQFVLFTAFVLLMKPLVFDPLIRLFEERERRTTGAVASARALDEKAIALKNEVEGRLDEVRREAAAKRDQLRAEAARLEAEMLAAAREAANRTAAEGKAKVAAEIDRVAHELQAGRAAMAAEVASRVLGREVKP
jgi:F-type H+-transporting ATPase subunit b